MPQKVPRRRQTSFGGVGVVESDLIPHDGRNQSVGREHDRLERVIGLVLMSQYAGSDVIESDGAFVAAHRERAAVVRNCTRPDPSLLPGHVPSYASLIYINIYPLLDLAAHATSGDVDALDVRIFAGRENHASVWRECTGGRLFWRVDEPRPPQSRPLSADAGSCPLDTIVKVA